MKNIYVTNDTGQDFDTARIFLQGGGEIIKVTEGKVNPFNTENLLKKAHAFAMSFDPENDFILICGNGIVSTFVTCEIVKFHNCQIKYLLWNHNKKEYVQRII